MTSMYIRNVARAMLTSFLLGGLGLTGYGSRSFFSSSNTSLMILNYKSLLAAMILSTHKPYIS